MDFDHLIYELLCCGCLYLSINNGHLHWMKYFVYIYNYTIILWTCADYQFHLVFGGFEGQGQSILVRLLKTTKFNLLLSIMDDGSLIGGGGGSRLFLL